MRRDSPASLLRPNVKDPGMFNGRKKLAELVTLTRYRQYWRRHNALSAIAAPQHNRAGERHRPRRARVAIFRPAIPRTK